MYSLVRAIEISEWHWIILAASVHEFFILQVDCMLQISVVRKHQKVPSLSTNMNSDTWVSRDNKYCEGHDMRLQCMHTKAKVKNIEHSVT